MSRSVHRVLYLNRNEKTGKERKGRKKESGKEIRSTNKSSWSVIKDGLWARLSREEGQTWLEEHRITRQKEKVGRRKRKQFITIMSIQRMSLSSSSISFPWFSVYLTGGTGIKRGEKPSGSRMNERTNESILEVSSGITSPFFLLLLILLSRSSSPPFFSMMILITIVIIIWSILISILGLSVSKCAKHFITLMVPFMIIHSPSFLPFTFPFSSHSNCCSKKKMFGCQAQEEEHGVKWPSFFSLFFLDYHSGSHFPFFPTLPHLHDDTSFLPPCLVRPHLFQETLYRATTKTVQKRSSCYRPQAADSSFSLFIYQILVIVSKKEQKRNEKSLQMLISIKLTVLNHLS